MYSVELGSEIFCLRASLEDSSNLIAVGTEHSVEVFLLDDQKLANVASFHVGQRITALAFSPKTTSPPRSPDDWTIEIVAASANFGLHLLTKGAHSDNNVFSFGGGLSGHHGTVVDITFSGGLGEDAMRYVATVSADRLLIIWDLYPTSTPSSPTSPSNLSPSPTPRSQPTAYTIAFPHELRSVCSHPSSSKEFLVADARGSIFLTDWRSDPEETGDDSWRVFELVDPHALAASHSAPVGGGSASWKRDNVDIIGAVFDSRYSVWDVQRLQGGKPLMVFLCEGADRFRWSPTMPVFAISTTTIQVAPRPHVLRDFDWVKVGRTPHIAAAVGRRIMVVGVDIDA
ncbi:WD-REPEATS-REGION domain-containing protein [Mycena chlorophos]|uniref:WD-REPEATS-REGION domain-containing protein n=1 Tax=Mycena chlorophos TaxID=658473 RepID=A0A8H6WMK5_MYCCL|nr:WD-REPEATS-REGION domain-containing protein [Mycena chlorophos]